MSTVRILYVPFPTIVEARIVAHQLLDERLVACANLLAPMQSIFTWQGVREDTEEVPVLFKTDEATEARARARLEELHSYECPCIITLPTDAVNAGYEAWVRAATVSP